MRFHVSVAIAVLAFAGAAVAEEPTDLVARGKYLATAGDCVACHSAPGGQPFAGGLKMNTPFGNLVTPNITSDDETGIGKITDDQFYRVMHEGIGMHGEYLYPVFPFPWYTHITRDDALAIKAYLFTVPKVHQQQVVNQLPFPFNVRESLFGWRALFFKEGTFQPDPAKSEKINRGAYLVTGLGHCAECHSPHNVLGATEESKSYAGAPIDNWYAPNISSSPMQGIGSWSEDDLFQYLKTGVSPDKGIVAGPMAQVVHDSLSQLTDDDVHAIAAYLKQLPAQKSYPEVRPVSATTADPPGVQVYANNCAFCHGQNGEGRGKQIPALSGNGSVQAEGPQDVIKVVLGGLPAFNSYMMMPGVGADMSDQQVADVVNYVRSAWSNRAPANVGPGEVAALRPKTVSMMNGGPCDPADPALVSEKAGVMPLLHGLNEQNMPLRVAQIVDHAHTAMPQAGHAELINKLVGAYCPILKADDTVPGNQKVQQLGTFAGLVYGQIVAPGRALN